MGVYAVRQGLQEGIVCGIAFWLWRLFDIPCYAHVII